MIKNIKLIEWIKINYPIMKLNESDLSELDFWDMDKFANWLQEIKNVQPLLQQHNVSFCISRAGRRNRTCDDLGIKNKGGMLDLFDNAIKEIYRITDEEYDYLFENLTDGETNLFVAEKLTFGEKKQCLSIVEKHLANYAVSKGSS